MGLGTLLPAILFGLAGLIVIAFCVRVLFRSIFGDVNFLTLKDNRKLTSRTELLLRAKTHLQQDSYDAAYPLLRNAFLLDLFNRDDRFINRLHDHHLSVLGAVLTISEQKVRRIPNLPIVEELLQIRATMLKAYHEAVLTKRALSSQRKNKGKSPKWAVQEFQKKIQELKEKLTENRQSIERELDKLFATLQNRSGEESEVTYH